MLNGRPIGRARSKREAVELALRTLVNLQQQAEIRAFRGRLAWEGDLETQRLDHAIGERQAGSCAARESPCARRLTRSSPPPASASQKPGGYEANLPLLFSDRDFQPYVEHLGLELAWAPIGGDQQDAAGECHVPGATHAAD